MIGFVLFQRLKIGTHLRDKLDPDVEGAPLRHPVLLDDREPTFLHVPVDQGVRGDDHGTDVLGIRVVLQENI